MVVNQDAYVARSRFYIMIPTFQAEMHAWRLNVSLQEAPWSPREMFYCTHLLPNMEHRCKYGRLRTGAMGSNPLVIIIPLLLVDVESRKIEARRRTMPARPECQAREACLG